jgi:hypothetical protein
LVSLTENGRVPIMRTTLLFLTLAVSFALLPARAATYFVKPDGTGNFATIQAAVNAAVNGDIIELADGTFRGPGNRDVNYLGKAVTIRSRSGFPLQCIVDCQGSVVTPHQGFVFTHQEGHGAILQGITITNACGTWGGGVALSYQTSPQIINCVFTRNQSPQSEGGGMCLQSDASPTITGCVFIGNTALDGGGLSITNGFGQSGPTVTGCTFYGNVATEEGGGVRL